jgi:hypothetical protein
MRTQLRFGLSQEDLDLPDEKLAGRFAGPRRSDPTTIQEEVRRALARPIDAPELRFACTPDDRVTIVLDPDLPSAADLVVPILETLIGGAGVAADRIAILHAAPADPRNVERLVDDLPDALADVHVAEHLPGDTASLAYLASTRDGQRVYLNRLLVDADLVFVVGRAGYDATLGRCGPVGAVFPALSNEEAQARGRRTAMESRQSADSLFTRQRCDEVSRLAGLFYGMAVALDAEGQVDRIWLGRIDRVQTLANAYIDEAWTVDEPETAPGLVLAVCSPSTTRSTWGEVGAALATAARLLPDGFAPIVVVSDIEASPGPACRILSAQNDPWFAASQVRESGAADAVGALQCAQALSQARVYLLSRWKDEFVESLHAAPVASMHEIENLVGAADSVYLVESADRVCVRPRS